jgi:hypothetical protein
MALLHAVVQVLILAMQHLVSYDPANRLLVGWVIIRSQAQRLLIAIEDAAQEATPRGRAEASTPPLLTIHDLDLCLESGAKEG